MWEAAKDRISNLPDSLLHHIHSFLDIKDGARTSVLSKRWNYIWTTVPTLVFRNTKFIESTSSETEQFMDFVDGTLHRHKLSDVHKFSLRWICHLNQSRLHSWISNVIRGNVKELSLFLRQNHPFFIPPSLFTCGSLITLGIHTYPSIRCLPKYITFPRLKRLELGRFEINDESWNEELFSNSTVLEELILDGCIYHMRNFCISIPTLKLLEIDNLGYEEDGLEESALRDCVFNIDAPGLVTFSYSGYTAKEFVLSSFPELVEATLSFHFQENVCAEAVWQLLRAFANVNSLTVDDKTLQAICCSTSNLPNNLLTFHNVKTLNISYELTTNQGLITLLRAVLNLESLVFDSYMIDEIEEDIDEEDEDSNDQVEEDRNVEHEENNDADSFEGQNNEDVGDVSDTADRYSNNADFIEGENNHVNEGQGDVSDAVECDINNKMGGNDDNQDGIVTNGCLFPRLKSVCFQQFVGNPKEMNCVKLILRDAKALQMMTIRYYGFGFRSANTKSEKEHMAEIKSIPRASADCVLKFSSRDGRF